MTAQSHQHKACYGTMFPDPFHPEDDRKKRGKVFSLHEVGPYGMSAPHRQVVTDLHEWDDCLACPEFEHCYRLCTAKLALVEAVEIR